MSLEVYNLHIRAIHVVGADNILADDISLFHEPSHLRNFFSDLLEMHPHASAVPTCSHMSASTYFGLLGQYSLFRCK